MSAQTMLKTILIVDDNPILTELFDEVLNELFHVKVASSVTEAITELSSNNIDAIVCDYHLGAQNAEVLIAWLYEQQPELINKFLILTGSIQLNLSTYENTFPVLYKPVEMEKLLAAVENLFEQRQKVVVQA